MPDATSNNLAGHRAKYDHLSRTLPADEVGPAYVGGGDPVLHGFKELEVLRAHAELTDAAVIDVGCGIGRLTQHLVAQPIRSYLGLDIIPEVLKEAVARAAGDRRFRFAVPAECVIPADDVSSEIVVGFSLITHLMDEEAFDYIREASRVLRPSRVAIFSFLDFNLPTHAAMFLAHAGQHRNGHGDILKFTTKDVLRLFGHEAGFTDVAFVDGTDELCYSGAGSSLLDVGTLPSRYQFGQSLSIFRK
jgi:SAM-dependent methyltransferase